MITNMRSFYDHLQSIHPKEEGTLAPQPTLRTSAIFPVFEDGVTSTRVLFMGYWKVKRGISPLALIATLRNESGETVGRSTQIIDQVKAFSLQASSLLPKGFSAFRGSLEVEFFSVTDLVFAYPAVVVNYIGQHSNTLVHIAQRVYNNYEDYMRNNLTSVPEAGFNLYGEKNSQPFLTLINGIVEMPSQIAELTLYDENKHVDTLKIELPALPPYGTYFLDLQDRLPHQRLSASFRFRLNWVYPRLIVGNRNVQDETLSVTHTYYDCSKEKSESDYWQPTQRGWHDAALMIPLKIDTDHYTRVNFYPIYSPATFTISVEFYDHQGKMVGSLPNHLLIEAPRAHIDSLDFKELCEKANIDTSQACTARLIADVSGKSDRIPARIKLALDCGREPQKLPCNICVNMHPFSPGLDEKNHCFRWAPLLADASHTELWILNSAPHSDYQKEANLTLTFYRESDEEHLEKKLTLGPHASKLVTLDEELKSFFQGKPGWCTIVGDTPFVTSFYFVEEPPNSFGGDHGF